MNPAKTSPVPFTRRTKLHDMRTLKMNGEEIGWKTEMKYPGIMLDKKFLWNQHVDYTVPRATSALMVYIGIAGKMWGCPPHILHWMYTMIARPIIMSGAVAWSDRMRLVTAWKTLDKVQQLACLFITGRMRSC